MKKLENEIDLKGLGMPVKATLIERAEDKAIYERSDGYFEVFKIKVSKESEVFGKSYPVRETYPGNEDFGYSAWCYRSLDKANAKYRSI